MKFDPVEYEKGSAPRFTAGADLIDLLDIKDGERVLDIGCGNGSVTASIRELAPMAEITAIDSSAEMVNGARARYAGYSIHFQVADFLNTDFFEQFDVVFSNSVFHWFPHKAAACESICAALIKGGRFGIQTPSNKFCSLLFTDSMDNAARDPRFNRYFDNFQLPWKFPSKNEMENIFCNMYLKRFRVFLRDYEEFFSSTKEIIAYLRGAGLQPYLERLPSKLQDEFVTRLEDILIKELASNAVSLQFNRLFAIGIK